MDDHSDLDDIYSDRKICDVCGVDFKATYLKQHLARKHGLGRSERGRRISCPLCQTCFNYRVQLRSHVQEVHNVEITAYSFELDNYDDFLTWLKNEENANKIRFCKARSPIQLDDGTKKRSYYCQYDNNRNTKVIPQEKRRRALKKAGSCKMTGCCPAEIIVSVQITQKVYVEYYSTHIGHEVSVEHFRLSYECRRDLADKIEAGVSFDAILNDMRDVTDGKPKQNDRIISRKILHNIAAMISITSWKLDSNVATSVNLWVESMKKLDFNPVCHFKKHGEVHPMLETNDFLLILMTKIQAKVLREFGNGLVGVKSTPGTKQYNFSLTTVLVVDDHEEPFPAAFLISNRTDETVLKILFSEISAKIDALLSPKIFLSDDSRKYFRAWMEVMKPKTTPRALSCTWDVDKNWRLALNKIGSEDGKVNSKQVAVYRKLRLLLEEQSQAIFFRLLGPIMTDLLMDERTQNFGNFFKRRYVDRFELWANSFRVGTESVYSGIENLHRVVVKAFDKGLKIKRLDACIYSLLRIIRDKHTERVMRQTNEIPFVLQKLTATHRRAMAILNSDVERNNSYFQVISQTDRKTLHVVEKIHETCPFSCNLVCDRCNVCVHAYQCSCVDYIIKCNMCTHVHKVCHFVAGKPDVQLSDSASDVEVVVDLDEEVEHVRSSPADSQRLWDEAVHELNASIERLVEVRETKFCHSLQEVKMAKKKVDEAVAILTNNKSSPEKSAVKRKRLSPREEATRSDNSDLRKSSKRHASNESESANFNSLHEAQEIEIETVDVSATFDHVY